MPTSQYQIPHIGSTSDTVLGWATEAKQEGEAWLASQYPSMDWEKALRALSGPDGDNPLGGMSQLTYKRTKRTAREMVASLAQFRHYGETKVVWDQQLFDTATTLTRLDANWYRHPTVHDEHRKGLQYAVALGTGYWVQTWDPFFHNRTRGDVRLRAFSPKDVTFVQLPADHDMQRAYAVIFREEMPINVAKQVYARTNRAFAESLTPDRQQPGWFAKGMQKVQQFLSPALNVGGRMSNQDQGSFPTVDIYTMYTMDGSINEGAIPVQMGTKGTNFAYTVPALGDPLPTGIMNPATGQEFTKPADQDDCLLFPLRRCTIFSNTGVGYDNTSMWWHGQVPSARLRFGDWAWEALGGSQVADILPIEQGIVAEMRMIEDNHAAKLNPFMLYDDTAVAAAWAQSVNPRMAGGRAAAPLMTNPEPIKPALPPDYFTVDAGIYNWIEQQEARMDYLSGVRDLVAIAKANQITGTDALEKLLEMAGPIVQELVRAVETPLQILGEQRKALFFQFYTRARMITITGPQGVPIGKQFSPEQLVPYQTGETPELRARRARGFIEQFMYEVSASGINEINRMSQKLLYLQLQKAQFPISWWSLAQVFGVPNFGPEPEGTNNEMERFIAQQHIQADLQVDLAKQMAMASGGVQGAGLPGDPNGAVASANGEQSGAGRPNTFEKSPKLVSKDGGTRSTVTTS